MNKMKQVLSAAILVGALWGTAALAAPPSPTPREGATPPNDPGGAPSPPGPTAPADGGEEPGLATEPTSDAPKPKNVELKDDSVDRGRQRIELDAAVKLALRQHPRLAIARQQTQAAKARVGQAKADYLPRIDGWLEYLRASENGSIASFHGVPGLSRTGSNTRMGVSWNDSFNNYMAVLAVQQVIYDSGRTGGAVKAERAGVRVAEMNEKLVEQDVIFGVTRAFYEAGAAREFIALAEDTLETTLLILEYAGASTRSGINPPSEVSRAEANVAAAEVQVIRARARLELAYAQIANAVGEPDKKFLPAELSGVPGPVASEADNVKVALANRLELKVFKHQRTGLKSRLRSVKGQQYPRFDALTSVNARGQFLTGAGQDPHSEFNWNVGVVVRIPIFQGLRVKKQKEELRAQMKGVDSGRKLVEQAIVLEVKQALASVRAADQSAKAAESGVEAAGEALEILSGRYQEGLARLVDLTDAQEAYVNAQSQLLRATYDRHLARAVLALAVGKPRRQ